MEYVAGALFGAIAIFLIKESTGNNALLKKDIENYATRTVTLNHNVTSLTNSVNELRTVLIGYKAEVTLLEQSCAFNKENVLRIEGAQSRMSKLHNGLRDKVMQLPYSIPAHLTDDPRKKQVVQ